MPPWHANSKDFHFKNDRRLSENEIQMITAWIEAGMPRGDSGEEPTPPHYDSVWSLGEPDLILTMPRAFSVPADGPDIYRDFAVPVSLKETKWIKAIEFRPSSLSVHHSLFFLDPEGRAITLEDKKGQPGFKNMAGGEDRLFNRSNRSQRPVRGTGLGGWAVGGRARVLPDGLAYQLPAGADIILSTHFHPTGKRETEQSQVGLYFAEQKPSKDFTTIQLPPVFGALSGIDIPAGDPQYRVTDAFTLPVPVKAFGVSAHMHYLGKKADLKAILPSGESRELLSISDWDFSWQEAYDYQELVQLPAGTVLQGHVIWDNSANNINNPSTPPVRVKWGRESTDEMGSISLRVIPDSQEDLKRLQDTYRKHQRSIIRNRFKKRLKNRFQ